MKEDTNKTENCQVCGNYICKCEVKPFENKSDTNTLREEFVCPICAYFPAHKIGCPMIERDNLWSKKLDLEFNQKLEEIEKALENHAKQNTYEDEEALVYKTTMNEVLQIIKNKKI